MLKQKTTTLATIFSEVLADLAFMFTDDQFDDKPLQADWTETVIRYEGSTSGALVLKCERPFCHTLAANLLGLDENTQQADSAADDAVKEFMNIVCGQFVTAAYGPEDIFDLSIPKASRLSEPPDLFGTGDLESCLLSIEGNVVQLVHIPS